MNELLQHEIDLKLRWIFSYDSKPPRPDVFGTFHVPFRTNTGTPAHFELPMRTVR